MPVTSLQLKCLSAIGTVKAKYQPHAPSVTQPLVCPSSFMKHAASSDKVTGVTIGQPVSQGFACTTCHDGANFPATYSVPAVKFPSGAVLTFADGSPANLCIECHQGRESTVSVNKAIGDKPDDTVDATLRFRNPHYFGAGATLFGTEAQGAYEYTEQDLSGSSCPCGCRSILCHLPQCSFI